MSGSDPAPDKALRDNRSEASANPVADPVRRLCHEISGPLTSILVQCDLLLEESLAADSRERIAAIREEALRISRYIRNSARD